MVWGWGWCAGFGCHLDMDDARGHFRRGPWLVNFSGQLCITGVLFFGCRALSRISTIYDKKKPNELNLYFGRILWELTQKEQDLEYFFPAK